MRKFNVKQLLLLIIRTLIILLIILAFSRPNLEVRKGFSLNTRAIDLMIIAIDNTASNYGNFAEINDEWLTRFSENLQEKGFFVRYTGITDFELKESVRDIEPEFGIAYSADVLKQIAGQVDLENYRQKSIVWLGDGQDANEILDIFIGWDKFVLLESGEKDGGIASLGLPVTGLRQGEEYQLETGLVTRPDHEESMSVTLQVNDKRQNQVTARVDQSFLEITARVIDAGFQEGQVSSGRDQYPYNDARYFVLPTAGSIPVQVLRARQIPDYWAVMESAIYEMELNVEFRLLELSEVDNLNLSMGGTVIVDDVSLLADYNWKRLEEFVRRGGQLIVFGDGGTYLRDLLEFTEPLIEESSRYPIGLYPVTGADEEIIGEPLKTAISGNRLKIFKRYNSGANEPSKVWIRFLDDRPFLGSSKLAEGRIVWFNTDFSTQAGNLPLLGIFPTLMVHLVQSQHLQGMTSKYNVEIGDTLILSPQASVSDNTPFSIQRPDGTMDYQIPDTNYQIHYAKTNIPGIYRLVQGRNVLEPVAVNIAEYEALAHSRTYQFPDPSIFVTRDQAELTKEVLDKHSGIALWPLLLSIILLLWVIETYLSRIKSTWRKNV